MILFVSFTFLFRAVGEAAEASGVSIYAILQVFVQSCPIVCGQYLTLFMCMLLLRTRSRPEAMWISSSLLRRCGYHRYANINRFFDTTYVLLDFIVVLPFHFLSCRFVHLWTRSELWPSQSRCSLCPYCSPRVQI